MLLTQYAMIRITLCNGLADQTFAFLIGNGDGRTVRLADDIQRLPEIGSRNRGGKACQIASEFGKRRQIAIYRGRHMG